MKKAIHIKTYELPFLFTNTVTTLAVDFINYYGINH